MKPASLVVLAVTVLASGCWRPYYGHQYAPPAYSQAPAYQAQPTYAPAPVAQPAPVYQPQVIQQPCVPCPPCPPVICPPVCQPCY